MYRKVCTSPTDTWWRCRYDPLGRRIAKQRLAPDGETVVEQVDFTWDGPVLIEQTTTAPDLPHPVTLTWDHDGLQPIAQTERLLDTATQAEIDARFFAIVTDLVGTPTELVDEDGTIAWRTRTTLWGTTTWNRDATAHTPLRFPGQYHDPETGLHYNLHRYYDPATARYTTPDPLGLEPAPNPATYVHNPHTWTDPSASALTGSAHHRASPRRISTRPAGCWEKGRTSGRQHRRTGQPRRRNRTPGLRHRLCDPCRLRQVRRADQRALRHPQSRQREGEDDAPRHGYREDPGRRGRFAKSEKGAGSPTGHGGRLVRHSQGRPVRQSSLHPGPVSAMSRYSYCRILVKGLRVEDVRPLLSRLFEGTFEMRTMTVGGLDVEVRRNPDHQESTEFPDDFVLWPVQVEIEPVAPHGEDSMVETVTRILEALWEAKAQAVAACDFEDELPWNGGIRRLGNAGPA
ncbi:hypothetical protein GCM10010405_36390 [Streptomyces macrosporus]|uniref:RHS protein conserved region domain-containing protein n=1 Tax=Streptomyces macrosporus TaxID=44032 RepID=A0ABP5XEJ9_9ACTN